MVKVLIVGSVQTGERIYASTDNPGTGIAESHLPLGAHIFRDHTLLGMAMEPCKPRYHDEANLVKCFVCIVLGINSQQLSSEVENIMENVDMDIKAAIGKSNKRNCRRKYCFVFSPKHHSQTNINKRLVRKCQIILDFKEIFVQEVSLSNLKQGLGHKKICENFVMLFQGCSFSSLASSLSLDSWDFYCTKYSLRELASATSCVRLGLIVSNQTWSVLMKMPMWYVNYFDISSS